MKTPITIGGTTQNITPEKLKQIQAILGEPEKWVPENGKSYWLVTNYGEVVDDTWDDASDDKARLSYNNVYRTKEEAEKAALRKKGAELRYLPKVCEEYKTIDRYWNIITTYWSEDAVDVRDYYAGMVWHIDTDDQTIKNWVEQHKKGYEVTR